MLAKTLNDLCVYMINLFSKSTKLSVKQVYQCVLACVSRDLALYVNVNVLSAGL